MTAPAADAMRMPNGAAVPRVILGTAHLGSVMPDAFAANARATGFRLLDGALDAGATALDIAASYMLGGTERLIGNWMTSRRNRERLFLITKGGHPYPVVAPNRIDPQSLDDDLHASLRRLQTDFVDLYLLHRDHLQMPLEPTVRWLASREKRGDIRAWGVSNWTHDRVAKIDAIARAENSRVAASSPHFSLVEWTSPPWKGCVSIAGARNREARAFYETAEIPVLSYAALGAGFFSEHGKPSATYDSPSNFAKCERAVALAKRRGTNVNAIAIAYVLSQTFPTFAIIGSGSVINVQRNFEAAKLRLTAEELRELDGDLETS